MGEKKVLSAPSRKMAGDPEIERLCNLGALKSLSQSSKMPRAKRGKAKEAPKKSKKSGNVVVELDGSDDDVNGNGDSDVAEVNESSAGLTTETRAKKDVLEDSDESNDEDSPVKKKGRQT